MAPARIDEALRVRAREHLDKIAQAGAQSTLREVDRMAGRLEFAHALGLIDRAAAEALMARFCGLDPV